MNSLKKIRIQGFKSIVDQEFEPGQVNVLIGANGSGKTALLEAIGMLSAAISGTVDNEALQRRGVHLTTPQLYKSSFKDVENHQIGLSMQWQDENALWHYAVELENENSQGAWAYQAEHLKLNNELILQPQHKDTDGTFPVKPQYTYEGALSESKNVSVQGISALLKTLKSYAIYTPITPMLRDLITDPRSFSEPFLGLSGNRLANAMQDLIDVENETYGYLDLDEVLDLLDWIDSIKVESQNADLPKILRFTELFMRKDNNMFTAHDASEGSLYVFFLLTLAMHPDAPLIFAVENFDQALHPRLARALAKFFCMAIFGNPRQPIAFLTTHNPLVLDGLNLRDERVRLFAIDRDSKGYTTRVII
ncbi:SMC domain-containing protein [Candidatus Thiomargarita nelsonii]|uniref:SMC domain-containing protein n=1 Tax=Candidatus Thiomargarita nelsonii TaxID=1003181 RepID=A0A176RTB8_9GAMM|nr:SMC domain-containing protein [Candidatus Thiomargarita nelsonii]